MAVASDAARELARHDFVYEDPEDSLPWTKPEILDAINGADDWIGSTAVQQAFNNALPEPFKGEATKKQKSKLLRFVIERRWEEDA